MSDLGKVLESLLRLLGDIKTKLRDLTPSQESAKLRFSQVYELLTGAPGYALRLGKSFAYGQVKSKLADKIPVEKLVKFLLGIVDDVAGYSLPEGVSETLETIIKTLFTFCETYLPGAIEKFSALMVPNEP